jgi:mono/diheme cytochrome c family protein
MLMTRQSIIRIVSAVTLFVIGPGLTRAAADPIAGQNLAEKWCSECHAVRAGRLSPNLSAPTFPELAAEPSITANSLRALLQSPHETMPHITFKPDELDAIIEYITSLKQRH